MLTDVVKTLFLFVSSSLKAKLQCQQQLLWSHSKQHTINKQKRLKMEPLKKEIVTNFGNLILRIDA